MIWNKRKWLLFFQFFSSVQKYCLIFFFFGFNLTLIDQNVEENWRIQSSHGIGFYMMILWGICLLS